MTDIVLAAGEHFRRRGIANVGIVRPNDRLGLGPVKGEQGLQRLEHMAVAQIPGCAGAIIHDPIILLGVCDQPGILHGIHEPLTIAIGVRTALVQKIGENDGDLGLARRISAGESSVPVRGRIRLPRSQTPISFARDLCGRGIDLIEIFENGAD